MNNYDEINKPPVRHRVEGDPVCPACGEPPITCTRSATNPFFWCKNYHQWHYTANIMYELRADGRNHISEIIEFCTLDKLTETEYNKVVSWVDQSKSKRRKNG